MKRSIAAHEIAETRDPKEKSESEHDARKSGKKSKLSFDITSTETMDSSQKNIIEIMPEVREVIATHDMEKISMVNIPLNTSSQSSEDIFYSTTYFEKHSEEFTPIREAKTTHRVEEAHTLRKTKDVGSFVTTKKEKLSTLKMETCDIIKPSYDTLKTAQIKEEKTSHNIKKESIMAKSKSTFSSIGTTTTTNTQKIPVSTLKTSTRKSEKDNNKMSFRLRKTKASFDVSDTSNSKDSKQIGSVGCQTLMSQTLPSTSITPTRESNVEMMPKIREMKTIHKLKNDSMKISKPTVDSNRRMKPNISASNTPDAHQFVDKLPEIRETQVTHRVITKSKESQYTTDVTKNKSSQLRTHDNFVLYPTNRLLKHNVMEDTTALLKRKPAFNIVDEVYLRLQERETASQCEENTKLFLETYTQTGGVSNKQSAPMPTEPANQEHVTSYRQNVEKTMKSSETRALPGEIFYNVSSISEQDSAVYELAASSITVADKSLESNATQESKHKDLAAGDQLSKEIGNSKRDLELKHKEPATFMPFSVFKNYFISKTVIQKDLNQENVTSTFTAKPISFRNQASSQETNKTVESNETVWSVLKSYFSLPFYIKEDIQDITIEEDENDDIFEKSNEEQPETENNPLSIFKQFVTFPSVNKKKAEESGEVKGNAGPKSASRIGPTQNSATSADASLKTPATKGDGVIPLTTDRTDAPARKGISRFLAAGDRSTTGDHISAGGLPTFFDRQRLVERPTVGDNAAGDERASRRRRRHRRKPPDKGEILEPKEIKGRHMRLAPIDLPAKNGIDKSVQTEDDPEDPGRILTCMCKEFVHTQKIKGTGMFPDKRRRIDYVLVVRNQQDYSDVEVMKLTFLMGLVKLGFYLEAEQGEIHKDLLFIKLHASDSTLHTYAEMFGARRYFLDSHEELTGKAWWEGLPFLKLFKFYEEREWIASMRFWYKRPLRLSNYERSYIVHKLLQYKTFGEYKNYFGLERLIEKKIVVDAFALHNGPFLRTAHTGNFNGRQVLYSNWAGVINILWMQPQNLIHEYFGSRVGYFFTFYEFYNKSLLIAGLWGGFMMWIYYLQDSYSLFTPTLRNHTCYGRLDVRNVTVATKTAERAKLFWYYLWSSLLCAECEGSPELTLCPYTLTNDLCFDLTVMMFFENQYIVLYSAGIAFLGLLFVAYWRRVEAYWAFIRELGVGHAPGTHLTRPSYRQPPGGLPAAVARAPRALLKGVFLHSLLPLLIIIVPWILILEVFVGSGYEQMRPMSLTLANTPEEKRSELNVVPPIVDKVMEFSVLLVAAAVLQAVFYALEKLFHLIAYFITMKFENHVTYENLDDSLIMCLFWITFNNVAPMLIYFAWLKGTFYYSPISSWDMLINITLPFPYPLNAQLSYNMSGLLPESWSQLLRRGITLNCIPFSCFRQAVVVYLAVLAVRVVLVRVLACLFVRIKAFIIDMRTAYRARLKLLPTVEREYMLQAVSDAHFTFSYNTLVSQMALVFLFAPLCPVAPLLAFIVNMWDIRNKAHSLVVYDRRTIFPRVNSIGAWNQIIKMIFYSLPLFHCFIIARTQGILIYLFHKVYSRPWIPQIWSHGQYIKAIQFDPGWWWKKFVLLSNFIVTKAMINHAGFREVNNDRVTEVDNPDTPRQPAKAMFYYTDNYARVYRCRVTGFLLSTRSSDGKFSLNGFQWPYHWNYIDENITETAAEPHHYEWMYYKSGFILLYMMTFMLCAVCVRRHVPRCPREPLRRALRERVLRRLRRAHRPDPRPRTLRRRETKLLNEYI